MSETTGSGVQGADEVADELEPADVADGWTAELVDEARGWISDCEWPDLPADEVAELTTAEVIAGVQRNYDGGTAGFLAASAPDELEPAPVDECTGCERPADVCTAAPCARRAHGMGVAQQYGPGTYPAPDELEQRERVATGTSRPAWADRAQRTGSTVWAPGTGWADEAPPAEGGRPARACEMGNHSDCTAGTCRCRCHRPTASGACADGDHRACRMEHGTGPDDCGCSCRGQRGAVR